MRILAIECSANPASCAVITDGEITASFFCCAKVTHSQTLMPMVENMLGTLSLTPDDFDAYAVSVGPGSFTGVRIGISLIKGLAQVNGKDCIGVSTLEAMAQPLSQTDGIICCVMDARCNQVYNALFRAENGNITRICEDRAVMCEELYGQLMNEFGNEKITVTGDGTDVFMKCVKSENIKRCNAANKYQSAAGVALLAEKLWECGSTYTAGNLNPVYLRMPQAERELIKKQKTANNNAEVHI